VDYAMAIGLERIWERIQSLAALLRGKLAGIPRVVLRDLGVRQCGIVSFTVEGYQPQWIAERMAEQHININTSPPQYTLLDMQARHLETGLVRASVHYYNTEEEIERFIEALDAMINS
jgi:selenocysteine lyase/cysteine desulfurase